MLQKKHGKPNPTTLVKSAANKLGRYKKGRQNFPGKRTWIERSIFPYSPFGECNKQMPPSYVWPTSWGIRSRWFWKKKHLICFIFNLIQISLHMYENPVLAHSYIDSYWRKHTKNLQKREETPRRWDRDWRENTWYIVCSKPWFFLATTKSTCAPGKIYPLDFPLRGSGSGIARYWDDQKKWPQMISNTPNFRNSIFSGLQRFLLCIHLNCFGGKKKDHHRCTDPQPRRPQGAAGPRAARWTGPSREGRGTRGPVGGLLLKPSFV